MGAETSIPYLLSAAVVGGIVGHIATRTPLERTLYATTDSARATRLEGILAANNIKSEVSAPDLGPDLKARVGPNGATLYITMVGDGDMKRAVELLTQLA